MLFFDVEHPGRVVISINNNRKEMINLIIFQYFYSHVQNIKTITFNILMYSSVFSFIIIAFLQNEDGSWKLRKKV
jgi:hypothetical protein